MQLVMPAMPPVENKHIPTVPQPAWSVEGSYSGINGVLNTPTPRKLPVVDTHLPPIHQIQPQPSKSILLSLCYCFRYVYKISSINCKQSVDFDDNFCSEKKEKIVKSIIDTLNNREDRKI